MAERTRTVRWEDFATQSARRRGMSGPERVQALRDGSMPQPPVAALVGWEMEDSGEGWATFALTPGEHLYNPGGIVQGGILCALFDAALTIAVVSRLAEGTGIASLDLHTTFVRPVTEATGRVRCRAEALHVGGTTATARATLVDGEDRLLAPREHHLRRDPAPRRRSGGSGQVGVHGDAGAGREPAHGRAAARGAPHD